MKTGYVYILECADGSYYTGSTKDIERRLQQHRVGEGSKYTKYRLPITLIYFEEFDRIDAAFYREKQIQSWSRKKKEALIQDRLDELPELLKRYLQVKGEVVHLDTFCQGRTLCDLNYSDIECPEGVPR